MYINTRHYFSCFKRIYWIFSSFFLPFLNILSLSSFFFLLCYFLLSNLTISFVSWKCCFFSCQIYCFCFFSLSPSDQISISSSVLFRYWLLIYDRIIFSTLTLPVHRWHLQNKNLSTPLGESEWWVKARKRDSKKEKASE